MCADGTLLHSGSDYYGFADELNTWKLFSDIDEANQKMESFPAVMKKQEMQKQLDQAQRKSDELSEKKKQTKGLFAKKRVEAIEENLKELQNELRKQLI